ncbi:MAG: SRPBCC family protein [Deltaproteobacteria bacterium]|jgi:ribosome-associated toxin RatA of RatAB toxin-antitoxin module|nr:SRPBCC family protein [Deltaproteobacteria bacterium]
MKQTALIGILATALIAGSSSSPAAAADEPTESARISTAQIPEEGSKISWGQAVVVVDKPIDEVLPIIRDYANYAQFMPNFTKSRVLAQRGSRAMVYMEVSVAKGAFTLWGQLNLSERPQEGESRVVEARLLEGNIDAFSASWTLTPVDGGARTEVDFKIYVDPDIPLPSSVFSRENEKAAGKTVRALRTRVFEGPKGSS